MRKTVNLSSLINDCISMIQLAGGVVRDAHYKGSHINEALSKLGIRKGMKITDKLKAATSAAQSCDYSTPDVQIEQDPTKVEAADHFIR